MDSFTEQQPYQRSRARLELRIGALVGVVDAALGLTAWHLNDHRHGILLGALCFVGAALVIGMLRLLIFKPLDRALATTRACLGRNGEKAEGTRNQVAEASGLLGSLVEAVQMGEAAMAAESWRDLVRLSVQHRQLVQVGELGSQINSALPYRETADRALAHSKAFLRADFVALLRWEDEQVEVDGALGVSARTLDSSCCLESSDCPVRQAVETGVLTRSSGHRCTLLPHTMTHQIVLPLLAGDNGSMALLATATTDENFAAVSDEALRAWCSHVHAALQNARKYDSIRRQAVTDHLTRLYNRRYFMQRASEEVEHSLATQTPMSVVLLDIDHFKRFNDTYGHAIGDRVLQAVAAILQQAVRTTDVCARHGGEEFTLLLPGTPGDNAVFMANRVKRVLAEARFTELGLPDDASITISAGVATCPRDATGIEDLLDLADRALYRAKEEGRNCVRQHEPSPACVVS